VCLLTDIESHQVHRGMGLDETAGFDQACVSDQYDFIFPPWHTSKLRTFSEKEQGQCPQAAQGYNKLEANRTIS